MISSMAYSLDHIRNDKIIREVMYVQYLIRTERTDLVESSTYQERVTEVFGSWRITIGLEGGGEEPWRRKEEVGFSAVRNPREHTNNSSYYYYKRTFRK